MKITWIIVGVLVLALLAGGLYWFKFKKSEQPLTPAEKAIEAAATAAPTPEVVTPSNPLGDKLPELNPVKKTNPFKDVYKNPFE